MKLATINKDKRIDLAFSDHIRRHNRLAERRARSQDARVRLLQIRYSRFLINSQRPLEFHVNGHARITFVLHDRIESLALQDLEGAFQTTTWDLKELIAIQSSRDDSRFSINRILHPLLFAELGIVK